MQFNVFYTKHQLEPKTLSYIADDYSFDVEPHVTLIDFYIAINYLCLTVVDKQVVEVSGFCPYGTWIETSFTAPHYKSGILEVIDDLEPGRTWALDDEIWPIHVNKSTGWVCIGNPEATGEAVEFMNNAVAMVHDKQLIALWLKPEKLPDF